MAQPLVIAVSPYHLTTREAPAVAALLLADQVVTLLPPPPTGRSREDVDRAVKKSPRYLRLLDSWRWTMPLWHEGVIASALGETDVADGLHASYERIDAEDEYAGLRPLTRHAAAAKPDVFLDLLAADILKGGPDPGLNIPVSATLDGFAARHGATVARAAATSVAQRAEARLGERIFAVAVPVLMHASARLILRVREELEAELGALREAMQHACRDAVGASPAGTESVAPVTAAARIYAGAFEAVRRRLEGKDDDQGVRITAGWVSVSALLLPADVAMKSGIAAARSMNMRGMGTSPAATSGGGRPTATRTERLVVLVVKELSARPD